MPNYYLPSSDQDKVTWLNNLSAKLAGHSLKYGITAAEKTDVAGAAADWAFRVDAFNKVKNYQKAWRHYRDDLVNGVPDGAISTMPAAPDFTAAPTASDPGAFNRITAMVQRIKKHIGYSVTDGLDLGIELASTGSAELPAELKPEITLKAGTGGKPTIVWTKGIADGTAVYKDTGSGFQFYDFDNHPNYDDKAPLPATATTWRYKVIYRKSDEEAGQFSDVLTVHVGQ